MFGLMRFRSAHCVDDERRRQWRLHYCGTCKTLGARYGQRSRLLLNHDAVFLGELLTSLTENAGRPWAPAYESRNCFRLPDPGETDSVLRYAAAATVLLSEYKVDDHRADSGLTRWTWARRLLSPSFRAARADLGSAGFPTEACDRILSRQVALESRNAGLEALAAPTAEATRLVFEHGARVAGIADRTAELGHAGYRFGFLTYLIDAWEDFDSDARTGAFNALRAGGLDRAWAAGRIRAESDALQAELAGLGAPREYSGRLRSAVEHKLSGLRTVHSCRTRARQTVRERWRAAVSRARELETPAWALAAVVAIAFLLPSHVRTARTHSECLSLGLNFMAMGGLAATVVAGGGKHGAIHKCWNTCCGSFIQCDDCCCDCCCDCPGCECGSCDCGCCDSCDCGGCCDCDC